MRDRGTIVDRKHHRQVWRTVSARNRAGRRQNRGNLASPKERSHTDTDGRATLDAEHRTHFRDEADHVTELCGASQVRVTIEDAAR